MKNEKKFKVFISKYALSEGVYQIEVTQSPTFPNLVKHEYQYFHNEGKDWHMTLESALEKADDMRVKKIASLKKQLKKLEQLRFSGA